MPFNFKFSTDDGTSTDEKHSISRKKSFRLMHTRNNLIKKKKVLHHMMQK